MNFCRFSELYSDCQWFPLNRSTLENTEVPSKGVDNTLDLFSCESIVDIMHYIGEYKGLKQG